MNNEKYKDPTAEYAIAEAEKWEKRQQELEEKHGIKRGDVIQIIQTSYASGDGKIITKKVKARVKALYPHVIELQLSNGLTRYRQGNQKRRNHWPDQDHRLPSPGSLPGEEYD